VRGLIRRPSGLRPSLGGVDIAEGRAASAFRLATLSWLIDGSEMCGQLAPPGCCGRGFFVGVAIFAAQRINERYFSSFGRGCRFLVAHLFG
jgi:hypothetical protein